ncbi:MAG TPA: 16S rRNA (guanine(527)-N(7))-methyltransferase RsmG [Candidatus Mediterraneibacter colneyensis]|nr:16S rRNA (guanine(527)-N(7))-methyltransferase RsmG [Candidatus Mediterraneibacter colneyensis]
MDLYGSGAYDGFPGIFLSVFPEEAGLLLQSSVGKKRHFLEQVCARYRPYYCSPDDCPGCMRDLPGGN